MKRSVCILIVFIAFIACFSCSVLAKSSGGMDSSVSDLSALGKMNDGPGGSIGD